MDLSDATILITGGAGFVGSHLAARLQADNEVRVVDDLRNGRREWVPEGAELYVGDIADPATLECCLTGAVDIVVHAAADKSAARDEIAQFRQNNGLTTAVLARMEAIGVSKIAFMSSSTVYGEAPRPTPEDHTPMEPISIYGASKLAEEALLSVYAHSHDVQAWIFRFANIVGPRLQVGAVIPDFIKKLRQSPETLEILGDGRQEKSYMHVEDCVDAMCHLIEETDGSLNTFNLGTRSTTSVTTIADVVAEQMGLDPSYEFTGGDRGWTGDVPRMRLATERLRETGYEPRLTSTEAVRSCAAGLVETGLFDASTR
jgi:UDP-glucose 4-epimerase